VEEEISGGGGDKWMRKGLKKVEYGRGKKRREEEGEGRELSLLECLHLTPPPSLSAARPQRSR
jgi:hypothetical protein